MQGTVSLWHSWDEQQVPALLELIAAFQETHPGVLFDVLYVPAEDMQARYEAAVRDGDRPCDNPRDPPSGDRVCSPRTWWQI